MIRGLVLWLSVSLSFLIMGNPGTASNSDPPIEDLFEAGSFASSLIEFDLPYRLLKPQTGTQNDSQKYPLVIQMHGAGFRGSDNLRPLTQSISQSWLNPQLRQRHPSFVLIPQCPAGSYWINYPRDNLSEFDVTILTYNPLMEVVMDLLQSVIKEYPIDENRIYIIGNSMGAFATWYLIAKHPDQFAAAIALCGSGDPRLAYNLIHLPIWAFHGEEDPTIPVEGSRKMIDAIREAGGSPAYKEFADMGHNISRRVLSEWNADGIPVVYEWLFEQNRNKDRITGSRK